MTIDDLTLDTTQSIDIKADIGDVFRSVLHRFGEGFTKPPEGESMQMTLEQWAGGRWFRDRGNGVGHLWGHVQVIKPPVLLELSGPMFMSYPAVNHLELKLEQRPGGTHLDLRHRALGFIDPAHRQGVNTGWKHILDTIAQDCSARAAGQQR
jgi:Activator of Hsp90 ATPase homolog 1-like protein